MGSATSEPATFVSAGTSVTDAYETNTIYTLASAGESARATGSTFAISRVQSPSRSVSAGDPHLDL